jgi:hypothetical protein
MCKTKEIFLKPYPHFLINSGSEKTIALVCSICIYYSLQIKKIFSNSMEHMDVPKNNLIIGPQVISLHSEIFI